LLPLAAGEFPDARILRGRRVIFFGFGRLGENVHAQTADNGQQKVDDAIHRTPPMRIYLDNNATTPVHPDVLRVACDAMRDVYGNASSIHKEGQAARRLIEDAREPVARLLSATPREIIFTSGGSESNNAAIFGAVSP